MTSRIKFTRLIGFLTVGLFLSINAEAQQNALLWKISDNGLEKPSYIYGTIHLICPDDFIMTEVTKKALKDTDQVVLELDMDDPQLMTKMGQLSMNTGMKNISSEFSENELASINTFFQENYNADMTQFGIMKPFILLSLMLTKALDCGQPSSYENYFVKAAGDDEKEIKGLETVEFQLGLFDKIPVEEQVDWLATYALNPNIMREEFHDMAAIYKTQDIDGLHDLIVSSPQFSGYGDLLLYNRNINWVSKIEDFAKEKSTFFAVGAGHLPTEKGILALLKKAGYKVTPAN